MKRLLLILILTFSFQSWTKADDISEFQIEGMSLGESLLKHFEDKKIKKNIEDGIKYYGRYYKNDFVDVGFTKKESEYEFLQITVKSKDANYTIYAIAGTNYYKNNIKDCYPEMKRTAQEIKNIFSSKIKAKKDNRKHWADKTGKSKFKSLNFDLDGGEIQVACFDWGKKFEKKHTDSLMISIKSNEFKKSAFK